MKRFFLSAVLLGSLLSPAWADATLTDLQKVFDQQVKTYMAPALQLNAETNDLIASAKIAEVAALKAVLDKPLPPLAAQQFADTYLEYCQVLSAALEAQELYVKRRTLHFDQAKKAIDLWLLHENTAGANGIEWREIALSRMKDLEVVAFDAWKAAGLAQCEATATTAYAGLLLELSGGGGPVMP